ncbi:MAG: type II secretion system protein [Pseudomonadota bacterium]
MQHLIRKIDGVTLIELIATIVVVGIAAVTLMFVIGNAISRGSDPMIELQGSAVARAHLEEIVLQSFCDPDFVAASPNNSCLLDCTASACGVPCGGAAFMGGESGRASFDDVCDYDGLATSGAQDQNGTPVAGLGGYSVSIAVEDSGVSLGSPAAVSNSGQVLRVDVTVNHPALNEPIRMSAYRTNPQ